MLLTSVRVEKIEKVISTLQVFTNIMIEITRYIGCILKFFSVFFEQEMNRRIVDTNPNGVLVKTGSTFKF